jgi:hypothetical protein
MSKPVSLTFDGDPMVSAPIAHDLRGRYGADYRIVRAASVFAVGGVRLDSVKRVASAMGEGAMSVCHVHRYLATA